MKTKMKGFGLKLFIRCSFSFYSILFLASCESVEDKLQVHVSPEIEVMTAIQTLANYKDLLSQDSSKYKDYMTEWFKEFKDDSVVIKFDELAHFYYALDTSYSFFAYSRPMELALNYSLKEKKFINTPHPDCCIYPLWVEKEKELREFMELFQEFYEKTNFKRFFKRNRVLYDSLVSQVKRVDIADLIERIEDQYGTDFDAYHVIVSPLQHDLGHRARVGNEAYIVIGAHEVVDGQPAYDLRYLEKEIVLREFTQNFADPIIIHHEKSVEFLMDINPVFRMKMYDLGLDEDREIWQEQLARSTMAIILEDLNTIEGWEEIVGKDIEQGFYLMPDIVIVMQEYEMFQNKFRTLDRFFPRIVNYLNKKQERGHLGY